MQIVVNGVTTAENAYGLISFDRRLYAPNPRVWPGADGSYQFYPADVGGSVLGLMKGVQVELVSISYS